jgi:hypothetical protein
MIQQDLKEIYKFLFDFFRLLKTVFSGSVAKWKAVDLSTALKWTAHVEDLVQRVESKKYFADFGQHVGVLYKHWSLPELTGLGVIEYMRNATFYLKKVWSSCWIYFS